MERGEGSEGWEGWGEGRVVRRGKQPDRLRAWLAYGYGYGYSFGHGHGYGYGALWSSPERCGALATMAALELRSSRALELGSSGPA